jgi:hypothetical protein
MWTESTVMSNNDQGEHSEIRRIPTGIPDRTCSASQLAELARLLEEVPPPPPAVGALVDPHYRERANEVWAAAWRLKIAARKWADWWRELRICGDADPRVEVCAATVVKTALRALFAHGAQIDLVSKHTLQEVEGWLPPVGDADLGWPAIVAANGTELVPPVTSWQERYRLHSGYWGRRHDRKAGDPSSGAHCLAMLEGSARQVLALLKSYPATALARGVMERSVEAASEHSPTLLDAARPELIRSKADTPARASKTPAQNGKSTRDPKMESRDKWIYDKCCKGRAMPYGLILSELKKLAPKKGWQIVSSKQRIQQISRKYAAWSTRSTA